MSSEIARVPLARPGEDLDLKELVDWPEVQAILARWTVNGCALVERDGGVLDVATVARVQVADLAGTVLVIFHTHVVANFPWLAPHS